MLRAVQRIAEATMPWRDDEIQLGPKQKLTPEGFLTVRDAVLARCGDQHYHATEILDVEPDDRGMIVVRRDPREVFDPRSLASFTGKPVTLGHPDDYVNGGNYRDLAVGHVISARRGEGADADVVLGDLMITDPRAVEMVRRGTHRALSAGYTANYTRAERGRATQHDIVINHIALLRNGEARCGPRCMIGDQAWRAMTLDQARAVLAAGPRPGAAGYIAHATAAIVVHMNHEQRMGRMTRDGRRVREETSRECVDRLAKEWRDQQRSEKMPMASGILPTPPPVDPRTGIPMTWTAGLSLPEITQAWRVNDAARSRHLLRAINKSNARFWERHR
jgi:Uncharacterized protein conserved in bacteria (DUF2213)